MVIEFKPLNKESYERLVHQIDCLVKCEKLTDKNKEFIDAIDARIEHQGVNVEIFPADSIRVQALYNELCQDGNIT